MISLVTARKLKEMGLSWEPRVNDFFAIPERELDDSVFVISDVQATFDMLYGRQVVSFQGASEWALDSLLKEETVWMPREDQLRELLLEILLGIGVSGYYLTCGVDRCKLTIDYQGRKLILRAGNASEVYAKGILFLLERRSDKGS